jgi:hypothetical protein
MNSVPNQRHLAERCRQMVAIAIKKVIGHQSSPICLRTCSFA